MAVAGGEVAADEIVDLSVKKAALNLELLHQELAAALGQDFVGLSVGAEPGWVRVHVRAEVAASVESQVKDRVAQHDPARRTAQQEQEAERAAAAERLRDKAWADLSDEDKDAALRLLVAGALTGG